MYLEEAQIRLVQLSDLRQHASDGHLVERSPDFPVDVFAVTLHPSWNGTLVCDFTSLASQEKI